MLAHFDLSQSMCCDWECSADFAKLETTCDQREAGPAVYVVDNVQNILMYSTCI